MKTKKGDEGMEMRTKKKEEMEERRRNRRMWN